MYDEIHVKNLEVFANHGVLPEETALGQKFILSLTMYTDTRKAGKSDNLEDSTHYGSSRRRQNSWPRPCCSGIPS